MLIAAFHIVVKIFAWIAVNWGVVPSILLGISELLALVFPSKTGFGGILAGFITFLSGLKEKT